MYEKKAPARELIEEGVIVALATKMDVVLWDVPNYPTLVYHLGINPLKYVIKNGKIVAKDGTIVVQEGKV